MKIPKAQFCGVLAFLLWSPIPWLYLNPPDIFAGQPLAVYVVFLFFSGLSAASTALLISLRVRISERAARIYVFLFVLAFVGAYQFSGLAPTWQCFGKKLEAAVGRAAGQNCTTTCTDNDKKPCSGWSSCWDKFVSCSSDGKDQDGRNCGGCCFSCDVVCEEEDPPDQPPTIAATVGCTYWGTNGWCITASQQVMFTASDPQGYPLTISGTIGGIAFTCAQGPVCGRALYEGNGIITYHVVASTSGLTASGSTTWKKDITAPTASLIVTPFSPNGSNGWYKTPVTVSASGSDVLSGLASAIVSVDGGAPTASATISSDGAHMVGYGAYDNAGLIASYSPRSISIDMTPPTLNVSVSGTMGTNGWYVSDVTLIASSTDITSGVDSVLVSDNSGPWKAIPVTLNDGVHELTIISRDKAGNTKTILRTILIDTEGPSISPTILGVLGDNDWYISNTNVKPFALDELSGIEDKVQVSIDEGVTWTDGPVTLMDGLHPLAFRTQDKAGNLSTLSLTVKVDTTPPTLHPVIPDPDGLNGWFVSAPVDISVNGADSGSGLASALFSLDDNTWQPNLSLADGVHTIVFISTDNAGNTATATRTVRVDTNIPSISTSTTGTEGSSGWYVSQTTTIITAEEFSEIDHIEYNQNSMGWQDGSSFVSVEGINQIDIKIYDVAGNVASGSVEIKIDTTPPEISTSIFGTEGSADWYVSQTVTEISARDEVSGVDRVEYDQNSDGWQNGLSITSNDGVNTIDIRAFDVAGNVSDESLEIKVDTVAPLLIPVVPPPDGLNNWFVSAPVPVSVSGSDLGSGLASVGLSVDGSEWTPDTSLSDGIYAVDFQVRDNAGNSTSISQTVKVDTVAPTLSTSVAGTKGNSGWYVSQTTTTISARDETSSVERIEYNQNTAGWKDGTSVLSKDGINDIAVRAYDLAGNMSSDLIQLKVDTEKPTSKFTSPLQASTNTLIRAVYELVGSSSDTVSGVSSAEISLDGKTWLPLGISSSGIWQYSWDTSSWLDGEYPVVVRTTDVAGNQEATQTGARVILLVNNAPPHIKLTPEWFIWQSGFLVIKTEYFPVRDGTIEIADRDGRWPSVKIPFGEKYPAEIKWDRRFADGVLAPSGDYRVTVSACNIFDLCSEKKATIKIPWITVVLPTEPVATQLVEVERPQTNEPLPTSVPPVVELLNTTSVIHAESKSGYQPALSVLSFVVLIALMWAVSSAALSDKRPVAIRSIAKTITLHKHKGEYEHE